MKDGMTNTPEKQKKVETINKIRARLAAGSGLIVFAAALLLIANKTDWFAQWYSSVVYEALVNVLGRIFGVFPFSFAEMLLYIAILCLLISSGRLLARLIQRRADRAEIRHFAAGAFLFAAVLFFTYTANCGINYYRQPFAESSGIGTESYSVDQLAAVCWILTEHVNETAELVERNEEGTMIYSAENLQEEAVRSMKILARQYPELDGYYPHPKKVLFSWILSVQKITGIYSPFTIEANYNGGMTDYNIPFSACHELSHLRGFMQEEEANFIAYLACMESDNAAFQYSGSMRGWVNCMNTLYSADTETWAEIRRGLNGLAEADLAANRQYWSRYEGHVSEIAEKVNDTYLKANGQFDGIKSYNRMADLIVAYYTD